MTKALHPKRPALIPMLDSVVQAYLTRDDSAAGSSGTFGERATALGGTLSADPSPEGFRVAAELPYRRST